jgi:acetolactate synthase I/II/III large subunit
VNLRNDGRTSNIHPTAEASATNPQPFSGRGADVLVECLIRAGVSTIFGLPGDTGVDLYDALFRRTADIQHVLTRDERHAATMADAYARAKGTVGVVEVSSGGGTTYVVGGMGEAFAAAVPVLLITSDIHRGSRGTGALTQIDQSALFTAVTKWRHVVEDVRDIPELLRTALAQATSGRPGPVALIVPEDVLADRAALDPGSFAGQDGQPLLELPRERPAADQLLVRRAAAALNAAIRPAIVAGSGVHLSRAYDALERLADQLAIPVATSIHGKGAISDTSPWRLGVAGANSGRKLANDYLSTADLVLLVGTRGNATDTYPWGDPARANATTITIDITGQPISRNFPGSISLVGDARTVLEQLLASTVPAAADQKAALAGELATAHRTWTAPLPMPAERAARSEQLNPQHVVQIAREVYGSSALVLADPGTPTPNAVMHWDLADSGRSVLVPRGHGPMGWAVPGAIGAAFAEPGRRVVSFTADGSFAMCCGELETAHRFQLPITFIQLTNFSLGWIKMLQHLYEGGRYFGVDPGPIDAVMVAQACGVAAIRVRSLDELTAALEQTTRNSAPLYIDVNVTHLIAAPPAVAPWQAAISGDSQRPVY